MDHPIRMSRNTLNMIPPRLPTQRIRKVFYILDLLHKMLKDETQQTPTNQNKCNIKSLKKCHTKTPKKYYNIGSAWKCRTSNKKQHRITPPPQPPPPPPPHKESKIPRYGKKYPLVTTKLKPTLTSDSSKPKNETTTKPTLEERREERQNIKDNKRENYLVRTKQHQQVQWKHWTTIVKTKAKNLL